MSWPLRALIGPGLWAAGFSLTYALHGWGCARGWPQVMMATGNLHATVLVAAFLATLAATAAALILVPRGHEAVERRVVTLAGWIGFVSTALTLFPVLGVATCN